MSKSKCVSESNCVSKSKCVSKSNCVSESNWLVVMGVVKDKVGMFYSHTWLSV